MRNQTKGFDNGYDVLQVVSRVFALNIMLIALGATTLLVSSLLFHAAILMAGCGLVALLLRSFARQRNSR